MKLLEMGLALALALLLAGCLFNLWSTAIRTAAAISGCLLLFIIHLTVDGFRIKSVMVYGMLTLIAIGFAIGRWTSNTKWGNEKRRRCLRIFAGTAGLVGLAISVFLPLYLFPAVQLPTPTGPYSIGVTELGWTDGEREEQYTTDPADKRQVLAKAWYPADVTDGEETAPYAFTADEIRLIEQGKPLLVRSLLSSFKEVQTHSFTEAPITREQSAYPVILLSPAYEASAFMYTSFAENLASNGYIVIALEHPYFSIIPALFPDGVQAVGKVQFSDEIDWESDGQHMQVWVDDILFVLEQLKRQNEGDNGGLGSLTGKLDLNRVGMLGHSFGGAAAAQAMAERPDLLAGVNMDGFPYGKELTNGLPNPFLYIITSDTQRFIEGAGDFESYGFQSKEAYLEAAGELDKRVKGMLKNKGQQWVFQHAHHLSFSDTILYSPLFGDGGHSMLNKLNKGLLQFFNENVKDRP
ncbi:alpha/beta hydrolase family protein [Paenibacillus sp. M.A.Huq-81]